MDHANHRTRGANGKDPMWVLQEHLGRLDQVILRAKKDDMPAHVLFDTTGPFTIVAGVQGRAKTVFLGQQADKLSLFAKNRSRSSAGVDKGCGRAADGCGAGRGL